MKSTLLSLSVLVSALFFSGHLFAQQRYAQVAPGLLRSFAYRPNYQRYTPAPPPYPIAPTSQGQTNTIIINNHNHVYPSAAAAPTPAYYPPANQGYPAPAQGYAAPPPRQAPVARRSSASIDYELQWAKSRVAHYRNVLRNFQIQAEAQARRLARPEPEHEPSWGATGAGRAPGETEMRFSNNVEFPQYLPTGGSPYRRYDSPSTRAINEAEGRRWYDNRK